MAFESNRASRVRAQELLGCQVWLEPDYTRAKVDRIFGAAAESGLGWARLFLMWPMIERHPGQWEFGVYDYAFDAAEKHGIRIKATLTANSGPWHIGTPSVLHTHTGFLDSSQREPMRTYIQTCVRRYAQHPALGQWIVWNEPGWGGERTDESIVHWRQWLKEQYCEDLQRLNARWRTGYSSFDEIPFPEHIPHEAHRGDFWNSYRPWLDDWASRAQWLNSQIQWVCDRVREVDVHTEACVNPVPLLSNLAANGMDLQGMGGIVDIIGSSHHPTWLFTFADRSLFSALMAVGVQMQRSYSSIKRVEVTEVQTGNTLNSSNRPCNVSPNEVLKHYLACLSAGAESVTGWLLNTRSQDFEAGDWGLLDDMDRHTDRSRMLKRLNVELSQMLERTGRWTPENPNAWIAMDPDSQALEWVEARTGPGVPGRMTDDGANGASLLAVCAMQCGLMPMLTSMGNMPGCAPTGGIIVLSHLVALETSAATRLLEFVKSGGHLLIDATSGRKDRNAALHRPWPGGLAERIGLVATGLNTRPEGYELSLHGLSAGRWLLTRLEAELDPDAGWSAWPELKFTLDFEPCVWERPFGQGKIVVARGMLGPSLVHEWDTNEVVKYILRRAGSHLCRDITPVQGDSATFVIPFRTNIGSVTGVFAPDLAERGGRPVLLQASSREYFDFWTNEPIRVGPDRMMRLPAHDGVALIAEREAK